MSGYPARPGRDAFGPTYQNRRDVQNPGVEFGADPVNLAMWQVAGAGRTLPQAVIVYDGVDEEIDVQLLAFDPKQDLGNLPIVRNAVGDYTITFAANYPDQRGVATAFAPSGALAIVQGGSAGDTATPTVNGQDVDIIVKDSLDADVDRVILVLVW